MTSPSLVPAPIWFDRIFGFWRFTETPDWARRQDLVCRTLQSFQWSKMVRSSSWLILVVAFDSWTMVSLQLINWVQHPICGGKIELNRAKKNTLKLQSPNLLLCTHLCETALGPPSKQTAGSWRALAAAGAQMALCQPGTGQKQILSA